MVHLVKNTAKNYTNISNAVIRDERLSWKARGIFIYMWSQADNWNFYVSELAKHSTDGEGALQSGLKELEKLGYLVRRHRQTKKGVFDGMEWVLTDHDPVKPIEGKIKEKTPKKSKNPSDGKPTEWKNHPVENGSLRNNNNKNYQQQEITKESNTNSASHSNAQSVSRLEEEFEEVWSKYPNKKGKKQAFNHYKAWRKSSTKHTNEYLLDQLNKYLAYCQQNNSWYHPMNGSTWFNGRFDDVLITENVSNKPKKRIYD